jgi:glycosyltransferase involved in cell wall biosynthesis
MKPLPISVCIISGAEVARIGRALESVAGWSSEIIVVLNQEVQDGTEEIARRYGAKVVREPWKGHIAQKNSAADKASQKWILGLDADEEVSPALREEIGRLFETGRGVESFAAYSFPRLCWYCERWIRHGDWYPDRQTRLWQRGKARWGGVDPHDKLLVEGAVCRLNADLYHYSRASINEHLQKIAPFSEEFVRQHLHKGGRVGIIDFVIRPLWRFVRAYFIRLGFLDGWQGYYIAVHTAFATLVRYAKLCEHCQKPPGGASGHDPMA